MRQTGSAIALILLASATPTACTMIGAEQTAAEPEIERHYFTASDGWSLHYARLGNTGSPVILIHGSTRAARRAGR